MRIDEYLDKVCGEIRWKAARKPVREEIRSHLLLRAEEFTNDGDSLEQAEEKAAVNMGDAEKTGRELNRLHKPRYDWVLMGALAILLVLGMLNTITVYNRADNKSWIFATAIGLVVCLVLSVADIRKIVSKKPVYISLFLGSILLIAFRYYANACLHAGSILLDKFPIFSPVIMILSAGIWVRNIKTYGNLVWFLVAVTAGGISLLLMPSITLAITFLICIWAMLWVVKVRKKALILSVLTSVVLIILTLYFLSEPYRVIRFIRIFSNSDGADFVFWQIKYRFINLNWIGSGNITPAIVVNYPILDEYALINFMWQYGLAAGLAVISLCGVVLWRIYKMLLGIQDVLGRTVAIGLCTYITMQIVWNILMNFGALPNFMSSFIPMFSQVWSQTLVIGSILGLLIGLFRNKDIYNTPAPDMNAVASDKNLTA